MHGHLAYPLTHPIEVLPQTAVLLLQPAHLFHQLRRFFREFGGKVDLGATDQLLDDVPLFGVGFDFQASSEVVDGPEVVLSGAVVVEAQHLVGLGEVRIQP